MSIGNSPSQHTVIVVEARKSFALGLWFMDLEGRPADLTGSLVDLNVGIATLDATAEIVDPTNGYALLTLQAAELDLDEGEYPFAIVHTTPGGYSTVVVKGTLDVRENPGTTASTFTEAQPSQALEVVLRGTDVLVVQMGQAIPPGFTWMSAADKAKIDGLSLAASLLPAGGVAGQVLGKASATDHDYGWITLQAYDGTLNATAIPDGYAPVADGLGAWSWAPVSTTVDWAITSGEPGSILNKPVLGTAAAKDISFFSQPGSHDGSDITTGEVSATVLPRVTAHRGVTWGTADPTGGVDGDLYLKYVP